MSEIALPQIVDLGLTLEEAKQGLRAATAYESGFTEVDRENGPIIPLAALQLDALFMLLLDKGVFTTAEYDEAARLTYNSDLARREAASGQEFR
jgi:hypothetical protein